MIAFVATLASGILALALWYLTRSKQRRIWLPLLAVLRVPRRVLPRLTWQRPPLLALLCFAAIWLALLVYSTSPSYTSVSATDKYRLYVYIDFSASVSARIDIAAYREFLQAQWQAWQAAAAVIRIETSHADDNADKEMHAFNSADEFIAHINKLNFHLHATDIATALQRRGEQLRDFDRVIVVSDYDAYSWRNIHWQQTLEHLPVPQQRNAKTNFYLHKIDRQAQGIEVAVARAGMAQAAKLALQISRANKIIATVHGEIAADQAKTYLRVDYLPLVGKESYRAQLLVDSAVSDAIALDNTYHFSGKAQKPRVLIIADLYGARAIDDPLYQLHTALEVLGMKVIRQDHARAVAHDLLILAHDKNFNFDEHCLASSEKIWLLPQTLGAKSVGGEACRCFLYLLEGKSKEQSKHECAGKSWQEVLQASGASEHSKLWWRAANITVFVAPPYMHQAAELPVLTKHLLAADGLLDKHLSADRHVPAGESRMQERELPANANTVIGKRQEEHAWVQALVWYVLAISLIELIFSGFVGFGRRSSQVN